MLGKRVSGTENSQEDLEGLSNIIIKTDLLFFPSYYTGVQC